MDEYLKNVCDLLLVNYEEMKAAGVNPDMEFLLAGAGIFTADGERANADELKATREILDKKDGFFDAYTSKAELFIQCKLALADDPLNYFERFMDTCMAIQVGKLYTENNNILSAMLLLDGMAGGDFEKYDEITEKIKGIFDEISANSSKWVSSDLPFAVIAALNGRNIEDMINDEKEARGYIKKGIKVDNVTIDPLAKCMVLNDGDTAAKCDRLFELSKSLKKAKCSAGQGRVNFLLAFASMLNVSEEEFVQRVAATDEYLKQNKPFKGIMGVEAEFRHLMDILCVMIAISQAGTKDAKTAAIMAVYITLLNATRKF